MYRSNLNYLFFNPHQAANERQHLHTVMRRMVETNCQQTFTALCVGAGSQFFKTSCMSKLRKKLESLDKTETWQKKSDRLIQFGQQLFGEILVMPLEQTQKLEFKR